jgi:hypothetical protein
MVLPVGDDHLGVDDEREDEAAELTSTGPSGGVAFAASPGRRRSLSVATGQPSLETVVVKAKRAASSLWMLLHAQVSVKPVRVIAPFGTNKQGVDQVS